MIGRPSRWVWLTNDGLMFSELARSSIDAWVPSNSLLCQRWPRAMSLTMVLLVTALQAKR